MPKAGRNMAYIGIKLSITTGNIMNFNFLLFQLKTVIIYNLVLFNLNLSCAKATLTSATFATYLRELDGA